MRSHVVSVDRDATPIAVADAFSVYQQPVVPVVDDTDHLVGVIGVRTLVRCLASTVSGDQSAITASGLADKTAATASVEDDAMGVVQRMLDVGHDAVVVLDSGRVVGLVGLPEACRVLSLTAMERNPTAGCDPRRCEGSLP